MATISRDVEVVALDGETAFAALSDKEKKYAGAIARASWEVSQSQRAEGAALHSAAQHSPAATCLLCTVLFSLCDACAPPRLGRQGLPSAMLPRSPRRL